jgi:hypothetical protein
MYIFIDEAGDLGFQFHEASSTHFVIGCAQFPVTSYKNCVDRVKDTIIRRRWERRNTQRAEVLPYREALSPRFPVPTG